MDISEELERHGYEVLQAENADADQDFGISRRYSNNFHGHRRTRINGRSETSCGRTRSMAADQHHHHDRNESSARGRYARQKLVVRKALSKRASPRGFSLLRGMRPLECPLWVKSRHLQCKTACPLYPPKAAKFARLAQEADASKATAI